MEFFVYALAGVGIVATIWFVAEAVERSFKAIRPVSLESRIADLERRLPQ